MEVTLDIRDMAGDMKAFMVQGIEKSHKLLLACTPRLKARAGDTGKQYIYISRGGKGVGIGE
jgi:hypothetical protein